MFLTMVVFSTQNVLAFAPEQYLQEDQELRARELFLLVKCPVCQGQVIESSDAEIAYELRKLIRRKIAEGNTDEEIKFYLIEKFGNEIMNSPPFNFYTFFLWLLPLVFVLFTFLFIIRLKK